MKTRFKSVEGINEEIHPPIVIKVSSQSYDEDISSQVCNERVFMHLSHVQYLTRGIKRNALENI